MKAAFTPGPWQAVITEKMNGGYNQWEIRPHIAEIFFVTKEGGANAALLAASPDLLEALKDIGLLLSDCRHEVSEGGFEVRNCPKCHALRNRKAAISKAEGLKQE